MKSSITLILAILLFATACTQDKPTKAEASTAEETETAKTEPATELTKPAVEDNQKSNSSSNNTLTVSSYSKFPPGIDGCSCRYSTNKEDFKKGNWIYTFDTQITAFMNIEGEMNRIRMSQSLDNSDGSSERKLSNANYDFLVTVSQIGKTAGIVQHSGTIVVTSKKDGRTYQSPIYGKCGC